MLFQSTLFVCLFVCLFGAYGRINPCVSLASYGIKLNMIWIKKNKNLKDKIKGMMMMSLYNDNKLQYDC